MSWWRPVTWVRWVLAALLLAGAVGGAAGFAAHEWLAAGWGDGVLRLTWVPVLLFAATLGAAALSLHPRRASQGGAVAALLGLCLLWLQLSMRLRGGYPWLGRFVPLRFGEGLLLALALVAGGVVVALSHSPDRLSAPLPRELPRRLGRLAVASLVPLFIASQFFAVARDARGRRWPGSFSESTLSQLFARHAPSFPIEPIPYGAVGQVTFSVGLYGRGRAVVSVLDRRSGSLQAALAALPRLRRKPPELRWVILVRNRDEARAASPLAALPNTKLARLSERWQRRSLVPAGMHFQLSGRRLLAKGYTLRLLESFLGVDREAPG